MIEPGRGPRRLRPFPLQFVNTQWFCIVTQRCYGATFLLIFGAQVDKLQAVESESPHEESAREFRHTC